MDGQTVRQLDTTKCTISRLRNAMQSIINRHQFSSWYAWWVYHYMLYLCPQDVILGKKHFESALLSACQHHKTVERTLGTYFQIYEEFQSKHRVQFNFTFRSESITSHWNCENGIKKKQQHWDTSDHYRPNKVVHFPLGIYDGNMLLGSNCQL